MNTNKLIHVTVKKIIFFPPSKNYAIILDDDSSKKQLPIIIGTFEAQAIALGIEKINMPRPMTHDLITNIFSQEKITIEKIVVNKLVEGTFYAHIYYIDSKNNTIRLDSRPSDAIAIALRSNSAIYVDEKVMEEAGQKINLADFEAKINKSNTPNPATNLEIFDQIHELHIKMQDAIEKEDYEMAAEFRDQIKTLESKTHN